MKTKSQLLFKDHQEQSQTPNWGKRELRTNPLLKTVLSCLYAILLSLAPNLLATNPLDYPEQSPPTAETDPIEHMIHATETSAEQHLENMTAGERIQAWEETYGTPPSKFLPPGFKPDNIPEQAFDITNKETLFEKKDWKKVQEYLSQLTTQERLQQWQEAYGVPASETLPKTLNPLAIPETPFNINQRKTVFTQKDWKDVIQAEKKDTALEILSSAPKAPNPELWTHPPIFQSPPKSPPNPYKPIIQSAKKSKETHFETRIVPRDILSQHLAYAGGNTLINKIISNYEKEKDSLPFTLQYKTQIDKPLIIKIEKNTTNGYYMPKQQEILVGLKSNPPNPEKTQQNTKPYSLADYLNTSGFANRNPNPKDARDWTIGHEVRHGVQIGPGTQHQANVLAQESIQYEEQKNPYKNPYQTAIAEELKQGIGAFLTALRSQTGREFLDPLEIRQAIQELETTPNLQSHFPEEPMRVFNSLQMLKNTNPEKADQLLNAICGYGKFLVSSPTLKPPTNPTKHQLQTTNPNHKNPQMC